MNPAFPISTLLACRELDDALGLTETAAECLQESRGGRNVQHRLVVLLRQSVYSRLAGYEDTNDAERLVDDPTMRVVVGDRGIDRPAASTNTMRRFETEVLTEDLRQCHEVSVVGRSPLYPATPILALASHPHLLIDIDGLAVVLQCDHQRVSLGVFAQGILESRLATDEDVHRGVSIWVRPIEKDGTLNSNSRTSSARSTS